jgi:hypothetical protein
MLATNTAATRKHQPDFRTLHDRVIAPYTIWLGVSRLSAQVLALPVSIYDPAALYR